LIRKIRSVSLVLISTFFLSGCAVVASPVGNALLFTSVQGPVATGPAVSTPKQGRACASNIIGIIATGDASIAAAKRAGGITNVASVDHDSLNILGLYSRFCTIVAGK
jgi:hypothetical protein